MPVKQDQHFQPDNWQPLIRFLRATGLRRAELRDLRVREVYTNTDGHLVIYVRNGKGGKAREVPVLEGSEHDVLQVIEGCDPSDHVFEHIPKNMDVHRYRREAAQARYLHHAPGRALPPTEGRIKPTDYDAQAVHQVSQALEHNRRAVVLDHYLR